MGEETTPPSTAEDLILAAIDRFGRDGFEGASTRAIASAAGKPMSAITYHFGGKRGLYLAAARHIATEIRKRFEPILREGQDFDPATMDRAAIMASFDGLLGVGVELASDHQLDSFARFVMREQADPTEAFPILYDGVMGRLLSHIGALLSMIAGPKADAADVRLRATMLAGQILMLRFSRAVVLRTMGWSDIGTDEKAHITRCARANLQAVLRDLNQEAFA
jgi:AcrR family transcriptional regulator